MAEQDAVSRRSGASPEEIKAVSNRIENLYHSMVAMHDFCTDMIGGSPTLDTGSVFVMFREMLRSAARDMENCSEILSRDGNGYFADHFGKI